MDIMTTQSISAVKYEAIVQEDGHIELQVPFAPGRRVVVFVLQEQEEPDTFSDLTHAAASSLAFWDHPFDDEDWNND
ncbi:hypothetical protein [Candidatus Chloroploca sp. Khr17]|uniref:hypothetical protein n=1 Tax=Candidatus Chloroploca sp. Khr17 TaxID=2496869 RepID=UPI00101D743E|nr:hypothetical protein [Candidatus Chloroploca sp. Khr17]